MVKAAATHAQCGFKRVFCKILPSVANYCKILEDVSTHTGSCLKWCMALERTAKYRIVFSSYCKTVKSICTHTRVCQRLLQDTLSTIAHASLPKLCKSQHCAVWKNTRSQLSRFSLQTLIGMCFKHMECVSNFDKTMIRCVSNNDGLTYHRCYNCLL